MGVEGEVLHGEQIFDRDLDVHRGLWLLLRGRHRLDYLWTTSRGCHILAVDLCRASGVLHLGLRGDAGEHAKQRRGRVVGAIRHVLRLRLALAEGADRHGRVIGQLVIFHRLLRRWLLRVYICAISTRIPMAWTMFAFAANMALGSYLYLRAF